MRRSLDAAKLIIAAHHPHPCLLSFRIGRASPIAAMDICVQLTTQLTNSADNATKPSRLLTGEHLRISGFKYMSALENIMLRVSKMEACRCTQNQAQRFLNVTRLFTSHVNAVLMDKKGFVHFCPVSGYLPTNLFIWWS